MKLKDLKPGETVKHYCFGKIVKAEVIEVIPNGIKTHHDPVKWGDDYYMTSYIMLNDKTTIWAADNSPIVNN